VIFVVVALVGILLAAALTRALKAPGQAARF